VRQTSKLKAVNARPIHDGTYLKMGQNSLRRWFCMFLGWGRALGSTLGTAVYPKHKVVSKISPRFATVEVYFQLLASTRFRLPQITCSTGLNSNWPVHTTSNDSSSGMTPILIHGSIGTTRPCGLVSPTWNRASPRNRLTLTRKLLQHVVFHGSPVLLSEPSH
jgi:hypothetical protein